MKYFFAKPIFLLAIIMLMSGLSACLDEGSGGTDGDFDDDESDSLKCLPGFQRCEGSVVQVCDGQDWSEKEDCAESDKECISGKCSRSGNALALLLGAGSAELNFEDYSSYTIVPFSLGSENSIVPYSISRSDSSKAKKASGLATASDDLNFVWAIEKSERRLAFDKMLQERARSAFKRNLAVLNVPGRFSKTKAKCSSSSQCGESEICNKGQCLSDIPLHFFGWEINEDITASVAARGSKCAILIDKRDSAVFSQQEISEMLNNCEDIILPRDHFFFGEPVYGNLGDIGDCDGDGLLHVLVTHLCNEEEVWGFFYSGDFYPDDDSNYPSNERNIIYVAIPESEQENVSVMATIAHEYQHLIHFVRKTLGPAMAGIPLSQSYEETWLDEGFAHLAEDLVGFGTDNVAMAKYYFQSVPQTSLVFGGDTIEQRAMAMLLFRYLFERMGGVQYGDDSPDSIVDKGGAAFLKGMIGSRYFGRANVVESFGAEWTEIMLNWLTTLANDGTGSSDDPEFNYQQPFADPFTGNEIGVKTRGERMSSWGYPILLEGPSVKRFSGSSFEGQLNTWAADFLEIEGSGKIAVELESESDDEYFVLFGKN